MSDIPGSTTQSRTINEHTVADFGNQEDHSYKSKDLSTEGDDLSAKGHDLSAYTGKDLSDVIFFDGSQRDLSGQPRATRLEIENCLVSLLTTAAATDNMRDRVVEPADFDHAFGKDVGDFLRRIDCRSVSVRGDEVLMRLGQVYQERVNQGVEQFRLQKDVSFKARRDGDALVMENIKGIDVDPYYYPFWKSVPDLRLTRGKLSIYGIISFSVDATLYDSVDAMFQKLGR